MADVKTIVILCDSAQVDGGLGKVAILSALGLRALGLEVVYFCPTAGVDPRLAAAGVAVTTLNLTPASEDPHKLRGMIRGIWNGGVASALRDLLAPLDPATTVVHCHGYSKALSPAIGPILTDGPIPSVYTMHEFFLACPNGGFFDFQRSEICTRKPMGLSCLATHCDSRSRAIKGWRVVRQGVLHSAGRMPRRLAHIITISDTQERVMAPYLPKTATLHRVSNPIDMPRTDKVDAGSNDLFVFVGRIERDKGALEFAKAAKIAGVRAVFVGDGRDKAAVQAILPDATFTGWLDTDGVAGWIGHARALVFPSLWQETFGLVACEALRRGVPVITGRWNAAHENVVHDQTGMIYDDAAGLQRALTAMTPQIATVLSQAAYDLRDTYGLTPAEHAARLLEVYAKAMT